MVCFANWPAEAYLFSCSSCCVLLDMITSVTTAAGAPAASSWPTKVSRQVATVSWWVGMPSLPAITALQCVIMQAEGACERTYA